MISASSAVGILKVIWNVVNIKVRMSCNYILPEYDDMISSVFQTESIWLDKIGMIILNHM